MSLTLRARNYRLFSTVAWEIPPGVSLLVGPNGSGKTTLLDLPELLRHALEGGMTRAIEHHGGAAWLRYRGVEPTAPVQVGCALDDVTWDVDLASLAAGTGARATDSLSIKGKLVADQPAPERHVTSAAGRLVTDARPLPVQVAGDPAYATVLPDRRQLLLPVATTIFAGRGLVGRRQRRPRRCLRSRRRWIAGSRSGAPWISLRSCRS